MTAAPARRDIDAALKLTGTAGSLVYGAFVAQEDDYRRRRRPPVSPRRASRCRCTHARVGYLGTWTDRPLLDRDALVNAIDYELTPNEVARRRSRLHPLRYRRGRRRARDGYEAWLQADLNRSAPLTHTLKLLYIDDQFDMNDLGYMERNSLRQVEWDTNRRVVGTARAAASAARRSGCICYYRENDDGRAPAVAAAAVARRAVRQRLARLRGAALHHRAASTT